MKRRETKSIPQAQKPSSRHCLNAYIRLPKFPLPAPRQQPHLSKGFTLIEVLVALFILSISVLAGLRAAAGMTLNAERQWQMLLAQTCADNAMVQLRLSPQFANLGEQDLRCPQAGLALRLRLTVAATPNPSFRRVDVQVMNRDTPLLRVTGLQGRY